MGHAFLLGDAYTKPQRAHYMKDGKPIPMQMGCYGIGVTRLIGAAIEKLSTETHIRWPFALAPFTVCIIPPEKRSKAFKAASHYLDEVHHRLNSIQSIKNSILVDDRIRMTIGDRFRDARRLVYSVKSLFVFFCLFVYIFAKNIHFYYMDIEF